MSVCLSCWTPFVLRGQQAVLPFLAPAVYGFGSPGYTRRFVGPFQKMNERAEDSKESVNPDAWKAKVALTATQTRKIIQKIRNVLDDDTPPPTQPPLQPPETIPPQATSQLNLETIFTQQEIDEAISNMEGVEAMASSDKAALKELINESTTQRLRKRGYRSLNLPGALRAVDQGSREIENQISMLTMDRVKLRNIRKQIRWLLDSGWNSAAIANQYLQVIETSFDVSSIMAYLILHKRSFRLSMVMLKGLSNTDIDTRVISRAYHMLVKEAFAPSEEKRISAWETKTMSIRLMQLLSEIHNGNLSNLSMEAVYLLARKVPLENVSEIYLLMQEVFDHQMSVNLAMKLLSRLCSRDKQTGESLWLEAFTILKDMQSKGYDFEQPQMQTIVIRVINQCVYAKDHKTSEEILSFMNAVGIECDARVYNAHIYVAAKEGDDQAVHMQIQAMISAGFPPNTKTYQILHNYYKKARMHEEGENTLREIATGKINKNLATDILHSMILHERPYKQIYAEYRRYFSPRKLQQFGIDLVQNQGLSEDPYKEKSFMKLLHVDDVTLAVMFMAFCYNEQSVERIWQLYQIYRRYLHTQRRRLEAPIREMLIRNGSYMPHIIMMGLGKCPGGLPYVARVLEDMYRKTSKIEPDVYTWSIFMKFLTLAGKIEEARGLIKMMKGRGVEPNVVTWTTLLKGYVRRGVTGYAEKVFGDMIDDGVEPNLRTWNSLIKSYIEDGDDWKAGAAFREVIDRGMEPDGHILRIVLLAKDRSKFEAGLAGESENSESVFEDGEVSWPELQTAEEFEAEQKRK